MLPLLAEATQKLTPLQKIQNVSGQFWLKIILGILLLGFAIFIFKKVAAMNKIILFIILAVIFGVVGVRWVYERDEPACMTFLIEPIANSGFLPTKGAYDTKQQQDPSKPGVQKGTPSQKPAPTTPPTTPKK